MADATATPGTITRGFTTPAPAAGAGAQPADIGMDVSIVNPGVVATGTNNATVVITPAVTSASLPAPTITTVENVDSSRITFRINITQSLTARMIGYGRYAEDGTPPKYTVIVMTPGGTKLAALDAADVTNITWVLNGSDSAEFTLPAEDEKNAFIKAAEREVQIWRGPDLMFWGVVVRARGNHQIVTYQCLDLSWYFTRRVIGAPETNFVANGSFEAGLESWGVPGFDPVEPLVNRHSDNWAVEVRSNLAIEGSKSLYMWANGDVKSGIQALQSFIWEVEEAQGDEWYVVAWCYIPSEEWAAPRVRIYNDTGARGPLGVIFKRASTTETSTQYAEGIGDQTFPREIESINIPIGNDTPRDMWVRLEAPLKQPMTGQAEYVGVQLCTPIGGIYWDAVSVVRRERLVFDNVDQALIVQGLVQHAQDTAYGKSDLNIGTNCPLTGVTRQRTYDFFNHELISDCIDEWPALWDGVDWSIELTPTSRTFTSWYPRKGTRKPKYALVLGKNIARCEMSVDGEQTSNRIIVIADRGEGAAREEAEAVDASTLTDDLILEKVYTGTPGAALNTLQAQADRGLRRFKDRVVMPTLTTFPVAGDELLGMIVPGDVVPVDVQYGWFDLSGDYRIVKISLDPHNETLAVDVNPEVNWSLTP